MTRRLTGLLLAIVVVGGWQVSAATVPGALAAGPGLTIVTDARYDVQPEAGRIQVTLDMVVANDLADTRTKRYYFDHAFLSVLPGASAVEVSGAGPGTPRASISSRTATHTVIRLDLGRRLYSGRSAAYRLVFDLVDRGGLPTRDIRVGTSLVSFPVWAYATASTPGSTVRVVFPEGYRVEVESGDIPPPTTDAAGRVVFRTGELSKPLAFYAYLVADRPATFAERTESTSVGSTPVDITVRGWADDAAWSERVGGLVARALPVLSERIGLPWRRDGGLIVQESVSRSTGGYAGLFDPAAGQVEIAYDAGDDVVLHEAAHAWFNGTLLADRWANEAFASYYGLEAGAALKVAAPAARPADLETGRIPLNAWGPVGTEDDATERYAYAASLDLARAIAERAGPEALRAVWADAAAHVGAYQPPPTAGLAASVPGAVPDGPETVDGAPDWRALLDLLAAHSATSFDDLWRTWVARQRDLPVLDARNDAREHYDAVIAEAEDWRLPRTVRDAMRAWRFDEATRLLDDASTILEQRAVIGARAAASGLAVPDTLRVAFESPDGFAGAALEAGTQLDVLSRFDAAVAARPPATDLVADIGLLGASPDDDLDRAGALFESGDMTGSAAAIRSATSAWVSAGDVGRGRLVSSAILGVAALLALILLAAWLRGRRRRPGVSVAPSGSGPYATLAATPDPAEGADVGVDGARGAEPD
jgi:hypothetical protein